MDLKTRRLVVIFIFGVISLGGYFLLEKKSDNIKVEFPIDSPEEAIAYAKTDTEVREVIERWSEDGVDLWANYNPTGNIWTVGIYANSARDLWFEVQFYPNGTIFGKGYPGV